MSKRYNGPVYDFDAIKVLARGCFQELSDSKLKGILHCYDILETVATTEPTDFSLLDQPHSRSARGQLALPTPSKSQWPTTTQAQHPRFRSSAEQDNVVEFRFRVSKRHQGKPGLDTPGTFSFLGSDEHTSNHPYPSYNSALTMPSSLSEEIDP
jgi:hypothetical protein